MSLGHCKLRKPKVFKNNTNVERLGESKDIMLENKFSLFFLKKGNYVADKNSLTFPGGRNT